MKRLDEDIEKGSKGRIVNVRIREDVLNAFDSACAENGISRTQCVQMLMIRYINELKKQKAIMDSLEGLASRPEDLAKLINSLTPTAREMLLKTPSEG